MWRRRWQARRPTDKTTYSLSSSSGCDTSASAVRVLCVSTVRVGGGGEGEGGGRAGGVWRRGWSVGEECKSEVELQLCGVVRGSGLRAQGMGGGDEGGGEGEHNCITTRAPRVLYKI